MAEMSELFLGEPDPQRGPCGVCAGIGGDDLPDSVVVDMAYRCGVDQEASLAAIKKLRDDVTERIARADPPLAR